MKNIVYILFLFGCQVLAQEIMPYFENFTKLEYKGENSNWDIAQHSDGTIYIANERNFLSYNGDYWQKYQLPQPRIIRSVEVIDDTIYTGAYHQFGYWVKNKKNKLVYHSLSDALDRKYFSSDAIWKIISFRDKIFFQSFGKLYRYNRNTKEIKIIPFRNIGVVYSFLIDDAIYITTKNHGIYKLIKDHFEFVNWSLSLKNFTIQSIVSFKRGILIATQLNGLFYYDGNSLNRWAPALINQFENLEINNLKIVKNSILVGTINNGLLVLNEAGNIKFVINKESGLINNTVLRQFVGNNNNLWLGLDNGLCKIYISDDFYWYNDRSGTLGTVYSLLKYTDKLVIGSNHGVFYLNENGLELVENSNGQVWSLTKVGNEIIVGHNNGTFIIKNGKFHQINNINGGMDFKKIPETEIFIQPNYSGLAHYQKIEGEWVYARYDAIDFPVLSVYFDGNENLWVESTHRGVYHFKFQNNHKDLQLIEEYEVSPVKRDLFNIGNTIFISKSNQILKYDLVNDTLMRDVLLENKIRPFSEITSTKDGVLVINNKNALKIVDLRKQEQFVLNATETISRIVKNFPNATAIDGEIFVFMDNGFLKIMPNAIFGKNTLTDVAIEQVEVKGKLVAPNSFVEIPFRKNTIQFQFSSNAPGLLASPRYTHKLEGYDEDWSPPSFNSKVSYHNLPTGNYIFKVRSINAKDNGEPAKFSFVVSRPWYFTDVALLGYLFLLCGCFYLIHLYNKRKYIRKQKIYKRKMDYEQKLVIQKHNFESNQKIAQLEKEKLKHKLKHKSKELASYAALMAQKEDILREMEREINKSSIKKDHQKLYTKLMDIRDRQANSESEWKLFERNFNEVHDEFFKLLQNRYPNLTPKDLQLCAYLKLNLTSKEIAPLIGITYRSVELHRYRIRKKFDLAKNQNLIKFLLKIG